MSTRRTGGGKLLPDAVAMREAASKLIVDWRRHSYELGFGAGIAQGSRPRGQIGFFERTGDTAIGTVCKPGCPALRRGV